MSVRGAARARLRAWSRKVADWRRSRRAAGNVFRVAIANVPHPSPKKKGVLQPVPQAAALVRLLRRLTVDLCTIAEAYPAMTSALEREFGMDVMAAPHNDGGNGNAAVRFRGRYRRRGLKVLYRDWMRVASPAAPKGLHMQRTVMARRKSAVTVDAVHIPAKSAASDSERGRIIREVAKWDTRTVARVMAGDFNWSVGEVLDELHKVDKRWEHIGGDDVMQSFGIGVYPLTTAVIFAGYGHHVSDHRALPVATFGVLERPDELALFRAKKRRQTGGQTKKAA